MALLREIIVFKLIVTEEKSKWRAIEMQLGSKIAKILALLEKEWYFM